MTTRTIKPTGDRLDALLDEAEGQVVRVKRSANLSRQSCRGSCMSQCLKLLRSSVTRRLWHASSMA